MSEAYARLEASFREAALLGEAGAILGWDHATMMPTGAAEGRAEQLAYLGRLRQGMLSTPELGEDLAAAEAEDGLDAWQHANLAEMARSFRIQQAVPADLNEAITRATSASEMCWREARAADDFATQGPHLEAVIVLTRESAAVLGEVLELAPYDAQLDCHERGLRLASLTPIFDELVGFLPDLVDRALAAQAAEPPACRSRALFRGRNRRRSAKS